MKEVTFIVSPCRETGGFVARWDDAPGKGGIHTGGFFRGVGNDDADSVKGYFDPTVRPERVRLHFAEDPVVALG